jgi:predicted enzyme related to lactoylglutathione lyase
VITVSSIVLFAGDAERTGAFYRALGVPLAAEDHGDGPSHLAADLGGVHVAVFQAGEPVARAQPWRAAGSDFPGFFVESLDDTVGALRGFGARILAEHEERDWGCRAVAEDPDGRAVEISQRDHCAP